MSENVKGILILAYCLPKARFPGIQPSHAASPATKLHPPFFRGPAPDNRFRTAPGSPHCACPHGTGRRLKAQGSRLKLEKGKNRLGAWGARREAGNGGCHRADRPVLANSMACESFQPRSRRYIISHRRAHPLPPVRDPAPRDRFNVRPLPPLGLPCAAGL